MNATRVRLSAMMFLQFFTWGAWFATLYLCLGGAGLGGYTRNAYQSAPIAAIIAPLFLGLVADRMFASQIAQGVLMLIGAGLMAGAAAAADAGQGPLMVGLLIGYMLCYMPTLGLGNSIAFANLDDPGRFPAIRVWGTIGWIAAGVVVGVGGWEATTTILWIAAGSSAVFALYSFTLPHTPPPAKGKPLDLSSLLMIDAFGMLKSFPFAVFMLSSMLVCIPLAYYYQYASGVLAQVGFQQVASTMVLGQISEIFFMLLIPFFFRRLGVKWMIAIGMLAWVLRYVLFAFGAPKLAVGMMLAGVVLHGICYDFFFVTGFMYTDRKAKPGVRGQAQSMLVFFTQGVGMFIGFWVADAMLASTLTNKPRSDLDATVAAVESRLDDTGIDAPAAVGEAIAAAKTAVAAGDAGAIESAAENLAQASKQLPPQPAAKYVDRLKQMFSVSPPDVEQQQHLQATLDQWKQFWLLPAGMAAAILVLFALAFWDRAAPKEEAPPAA